MYIIALLGQTRTQNAGLSRDGIYLAEILDQDDQPRPAHLYWLGNVQSNHSGSSSLSPVILTLADGCVALFLQLVFHFTGITRIALRKPC